jgi:hypothetical protein
MKCEGKQKKKLENQFPKNNKCLMMKLKKQFKKIHKKIKLT